MALFKTHDEKIETLEKKLAEAKKRTEIAKKRAEQTKQLRKAISEEKQAKREMFTANHPIATKVARSTIRNTKKIVHNTGKTGKEIIVTTLTSRKLGSSGQAGIGRKYRH